MVIKQNQDLTRPIYLKCLYRLGSMMRYIRSGVDKKEVVHELPTDMRPELVIFNAGMRVPCELTFNKPISEWILQLRRVLMYLIGLLPSMLKKKKVKKVENALLKAAGSDPFGVRKEAVQALGSLKPKKYAKELMELSEGQDNRVKESNMG